MLRHIAWFSGAPVEPCEQDGLTSTDPDVRLRCLSPARELEKLGIACSVFGNLEDADPTHVSKHLQKLSSDIVVIGKMSQASLLKFARAAKHLGCYVVADFASDAELPDTLFELVGITDLFVVANKAKDLEIHKKVGHDDMMCCVVPDTNPHDPSTTAKAWLECFKRLKENPPTCANTNRPKALKG